MPPGRREPAAGVRKSLVLVLALAALVAPYLNALTGAGQSIGAFSAEGDTVIRAARYAFSIWGLLYLGIVVYAAFQALPRGIDPPLVRRLGWPSAISFAAIAAWSVAAQFGVAWITPPLILLAALVLAIPLLGTARDVEFASTPQRLMVAWPMAALAGWLTIAAPLNVIGVLESQEMLGGLPNVAYALIAILLVTILTVAIIWRTRLWPYSALVVWGLVAVAVAEASRNPPLAWVAGAVAVLLGAVTLLFVRVRRR